MRIRFLLGLIFFAGIIFSQSDFEQGVEWYNDRHTGSEGTQASVKPIDKAIGFFSSSLEIPEKESESALYLLKCYYYKAEFAVQDTEEKKKVFNLGKDLGEEYIEKFPDSSKFRYWYLVNLGSWAQVYGIITAAREGVADLMKTHSEKIIELEPSYQDGGGYFMLGAVHFKSPYIPFLLSWPDNDKAIKYLQLAHDTGNATLNQKNYLAKAVHKDGQKDKAKQLLTEVINSGPNPANLVEELDDIEEAHQLLKDL